MSQVDENLRRNDGSFSSSAKIRTDEFVVKIVRLKDLRRRMEDFWKAKKAEVAGVKARKIWKVILKDEMHKDGMVIGDRFVLKLKNVGSPDEKAKSRYIARGYSDGDKPFVVYDTSTLRASFIRFILSVSTIIRFYLFSQDVTQAYLQSNYNLSRKISVLPKDNDLGIFALKKGNLFELSKPLYGICEAGDYWGVAMDEHIVNDLQVTPVPGDASLYVKKNEIEEKIGISGMYVDDSFKSGNQEFEKISGKTPETFKSKPRVYEKIDFFEAQNDTTKDAVLSLTQSYIIRNLELLQAYADFIDSRRARIPLLLNFTFPF